MEPSLTQLIVAALAVWEILEIWHHSVLFAGIRARLEYWENLAGDLLRCPFCLAPWTAGIVLLLSSWLDWSGRTAALWVVWSFAVARLANLANDAFYSVCRTVKEDDLSNP